MLDEVEARKKEILELERNIQVSPLVQCVHFKATSISNCLSVFVVHTLSMVVGYNKSKRDAQVATRMLPNVGLATNSAFAKTAIASW